MIKYYRSNPYLGTFYEISEKTALRKINSKDWIPTWDDYLEEFSNCSWYNIKDPSRDWIFKYDERDYSES